ncbi:hypothetical protein B0H13DRAFT_2374327 [Mycena leptocephala]|nr:hypothetical protein B0H13DRAFT_2374327 [Mycena leptocephala]
MSDPTRCRAVDINGDQCICMRADTTYVDEENRTRCSNCDHIASAHPQAKAGVTSWVRGLQDTAKLNASSSSSSTVKAAQEEAATETSAGLRNAEKRKPDSKLESVSKKANKGKAVKGKAPKTQGDKIKLGEAVMVTSGITVRLYILFNYYLVSLTPMLGYLRNSKAPSQQELPEMKRPKLVVLSSPSQPLSIDTSWTNEEVNAKIANLFPQAIAFLRREHPGESQLCLALLHTKILLRLLVLGCPSADRVLYIASKFKIAKRRWDWAPPRSDDLGSDIDTIPSEDVVMTPPKPTPTFKGKGKEVKIKVEPEASEVEEPDMRKAAKMRTRLASGALKKKEPLFVPGSDDSPHQAVEISW